MQPAAHEEPLQRDLRARDELLDQHPREIRIAPLRDVGRAEQGGHAGQGCAQLVSIVGADHSPASGQNQRLHHARVGRAVEQAFQLRSRQLGRHQLEPWDRQAGGAQLFAAQRLVPRRRDRLGRVVGQPQLFRGERRDQRGQIVHPQHGNRAPFSHSARQFFRRCLGVAKAESDGRLLPDVGELVAYVAGGDHLHAEDGRGSKKVLVAIAGLGQDQDHLRHDAR